jgi:hypothetical protein
VHKPKQNTARRNWPSEDLQTGTPGDVIDQYQAKAQGKQKPEDPTNDINDSLHVTCEWRLAVTISGESQPPLARKPAVS